MAWDLRRARRFAPQAFAATLMAAGLAAACAAIAPLRDFARGFADGRSAAWTTAAAEAEGPVEAGAAAFVLYDFAALTTDTLESHAIPWRLAAAALVLHDRSQTHAPAPAAERLKRILSGYGFLYPTRLQNWPQGLEPLDFSDPARPPLGMSTGMITREIPQVRLLASNLSCAACHAGVAYDGEGAPRPDVAVLGAPNTSLDLEAYVDGVYRAMAATIDRPEALFAVMSELDPSLGPDEIDTLRRFALPRARARLAALARMDRALAFVNGAPGLTNGVAALKVELGLQDELDWRADERGFTSIPELSTRHFRRAWLKDSSYAPPAASRIGAMSAAAASDPAHFAAMARIVSFFVLPSMGVDPGRARSVIPQAEQVVHFLASAAPQPFPGRIDPALAQKGAEVYARACASCHGVYVEDGATLRLASFPNWLGAFDTDPTRAQALTPALADAVNATVYRRDLEARHTGAYAAPPLTGLWMSAPYLHNGSVPTLRQLMFPEERVWRFQVGGHKLDFVDVGIAGRRTSDGAWAYPENYAPFSTPAWIDTRESGLSNRGHTQEFTGLSEADRLALIEFLKRL